MRLLILTAEYSQTGGGIATFYRSLLSEIVRAGHQVRVVEGSGVYAGSRDPRSIDGVEVETLEHDRLSAWHLRFSSFSATPELRRDLAAAWAMWEQAGHGAGSDVVEAGDWGLLYLPAALAANRPLIVQAHASAGQIKAHAPFVGDSVQSALFQMIESASLRAAQCLQTYSRLNADAWEAETGRPVTMIRPALAVRPPEPVEVNSQGLVVGRVQRWKGPQVLCRALALMGDVAPGLTWIGKDTSWDKPTSSALEHLRDTYPQQWGRLVVHHPPIEPEEVARRQRAALFNLIPSPWDVFNFTAAEAMASGRPTIVSSGAGASELIRDGENGYVFEKEDAESLADALRRVLAASPEARLRMGRLAQETVRRELDPARIAAQRIAGYEAAIADFQVRPSPPIEGWLRDICAPSDHPAQDPPDPLADLSMRDIASHLLHRLSDKVLRGERET